MARTKANPEYRSTYHSYDLEGWEGGIMVCGMSVPHGATVIAIPRLGLSTTLTGYGDRGNVHDMLMRNRTLYNDRQAMERMEQYIVRDFGI